MELKLRCDLCSSEFRSVRKLKDHKKLAHNKKFKCDKCNWTFGVPSRLKEHIKMKHEGKRYHCSYPECSTSFFNKAGSSKHLIMAHSLVGENFHKFRENLKLQ